MRVIPNTAFSFRFFVQKSLIHAATTDPHEGHTGAVEADFDVQVCRPGQTSFTTAADGEHTITELGLGWYECAITTTTNYIDTTTGPGTIVIDYNPTALGDGFNDARIWDQLYHVGHDPSDTRQFRGEAVPATFATGVPYVGLADAAITEAKFGATTAGGRSLLQMLGGILHKGTVGASTTTTITLDTSGSAAEQPSTVDDAYIGCIVMVWQCPTATFFATEVRTIIDYDGTTKVATLDRALETDPDSGGLNAMYEIRAADNAATVDVGKWLGAAVATPTTAGVPEVDVTYWRGTQPLVLESQRVNASVGNIQNDVITAAATAADFGTEIATAVWDFVTEGTTKAVEAFRGMTAALIGKAVFSTGNRKYRNIADTKDVIDATVDNTGRTAITRDLT